MEDLIGFLIIAASIIISIISSVSKNKKKSNTAVPQQDTVQNTETTENLNTGSEQTRGTVDSNDMTVEEKVRQIKEKKYSDYERQKEREKEEEQEPKNQQELDEEYQEATREEEDKTSKKEEQLAQERSQQKAKRKTPKRKPRKKSKIEEIQEDFDIEKGILYSEILNKKHF